MVPHGRGTATDSSTLPPTGAVLPILYLTQVQIANPTIFVHERRRITVTDRRLRHFILTKYRRRTWSRIRITCDRPGPGSSLTRERSSAERKISFAQCPTGYRRMALNTHAQGEKFESRFLQDLEEHAGDERARMRERTLTFSSPVLATTCCSKCWLQPRWGEAPDWRVRVVHVTTCWFWAFLKNILMVSTNRACSGCFQLFAHSCLQCS